MNLGCDTRLTAPLVSSVVAVLVFLTSANSDGEVRIARGYSGSQRGKNSSNSLGVVYMQKLHWFN